MYWKVDHNEIGYAAVKWIDLAQEMNKWWALVNMVINIYSP